ncbi:MAG: D-aminoacyl-tRNA deacylase [Christensenellales bacterium]|jgi:D-tyrosyl-tRNA(Tyr) deacylase
MRAVVQRTSRAEVRIGGELYSQIRQGFLVFLGIGQQDTQVDADYICQKLAGLRIFEDEAGKMNLSLQDVGGELLLVSQFTLLGDCRKGRRPSFTDAMLPEAARQLYEYCEKQLRESGILVKTGRFGADMQIELINDGPVTMLLDSGRMF